MPDLDWTRDRPAWPHHEASRFVEAAGLRWHVQEVGAADAPVLLLIHGTGAASMSWRGLMPLLAERFRVVAIDLPGHGFTSAPATHRMSLPGMANDLAQLLRALGVSPEIAVGHSAGAAILARLAIDKRIVPRLIVSLNGAFFPFGGVAGHLFSPLAKLLALNPLVPRLFAWQAGSAGSVERLLRDTGSAIDSTGVALYARLVRSPSHVAAALKMMANWDLAPLVRDIPALQPKLVLVTADRDRAISPDAARRLQVLVPNAQLIRLAGLGHLAHEEQPQKLAEMIFATAKEYDL